MNDALQFVIVTAVAGVAMVTIALPYLRRRQEGNGAPCAKCSSGQPCAPVSPSNSPTVHPLRLVRPGSLNQR
jgi:hypothetical protein